MREQLKQEISVLKARCVAFETDGKAWIALDRRCEELSEQVKSRDGAIAAHLCTIQGLQAEKATWQLLQHTYVHCKSESERAARDLAGALADLEEERKKVKALQAQNSQLVNTLVTVSSECQRKNERAELEMHNEAARLQQKMQALGLEVVVRLGLLFMRDVSSAVLSVALYASLAVMCL